METARAFFRTLRAIVAYYREAGSVECYDAAIQGDCDSSRRMNGISDSFKALLLASPGR
jgi:hypothetical protein